MTTAQDLGTIEKVDIREVWPTEPGHFTPWLGDNLDKLGAEIGLDLELVETEAQVGPFRLDVRAQDANIRVEVIIENQFGHTDHSHLGQLLTYASGFDAGVVVWIAENFRDEHREALDYLNHRTGEDTQFFGVEVELWKIGDSLPAVNFNLVSTPNEWSKQSLVRQHSATGNSMVRGEQYREFYQTLVDTMRDVHKFTNRKKAGTRAYCTFPTGQTGFSYAPYLTASNMNRARVELYLDSDRDRNKTCFDLLVSDREDIETELGELLWERLDDKKSCRISIARQGSIDDDDETLVEIRDWMVDRLLKFKEVFGPRLAELVD